jgi:hypothetical protein
LSYPAPNPLPTPLRPFFGPLPSDNRLTGTLSPAFGFAWPVMENLLLSNNALTGPLPIDWAGMGRLKTLYLK